MAVTNKQAKVLQWLAKANPHSGRLFEAATELTSSLTLPCRGRFVAHAYREICIWLMNQHSPTSRVDMNEHLDSLVREFRSLNLARDDISAPSDVAPFPSDLGEAVPRSFIDSVRQVVNIVAATPRGKARARAVFEGLASGKLDTSQTADQWFRMYNFFQGCSHDQKTDDAVMMDSRFEREVTFFEDTLLSFAEKATSNLDALDEILAEANS
jgi:hypothetical protein